VVRKVIRSGATAFAYERTVQPQPKLGPWREALQQRLETNPKTGDARSSRERLTLPWIFEELRGLGYPGGYEAVRRHAAPLDPLGGGASRAQRPPPLSCR